MFLVSDPQQPLDGNLRATMVRIARAKANQGWFDVYRPYIVSYIFGGGKYHIACKMLACNSFGKKKPSVENVSHLLQEQRVAPGGGLLSDGTVTICVGQSGQQGTSPDDW